MEIANQPQPAEAAKPVTGLARAPEVVPFWGGLSGKEEGFKMSVGQGIELTVLKERALDAQTRQEVFTGIEGIFLGPDEKGKTHAMTETGFRLALEGMTENDVPQVIQAIGTLVRMGAKPLEVANFVSDVELKRLREHIKEKFGV